MDYQDLWSRFALLTTAHIADACIRLKILVRCGPAALQAAIPGSRVVGRVRPTRHAGSVDIFLEAIEATTPGEVLVVDNAGRLDESCVGDLVVLEAQAAGLGGIVIWGLHRDTADIRAIGLPVFSLGRIPTGPQLLYARSKDSLETARVGELVVGRNDFVLGDDDGIIFIPDDKLGQIFAVAESIRDTEKRQAGKVRAGLSLRQQMKFDVFLAKRQENPGLTFRQHLRANGGTIEE